MAAGKIVQVYSRPKPKKSYPKKQNKKLSNRISNLENKVQGEKFRKTITQLASNVGQVLQNSSGYNIIDITPDPTAGDGYSGRTGSKIRLHSSYFQFQFSDMASSTSNINGRILIFKMNNEILTSTSSWILGQMFNYNTFVGGGFVIVDYNSSYNPDYFKQWTLIREKKFKHNADNISGQRIITNVKIPIKYNRGKGHTVQWDKNTTTLVDGQIFCLILLDNGNNSTVASTLSNIANTAASTGLSLNYTVDHYYYDN